MSLRLKGWDKQPWVHKTPQIFLTLVKDEIWNNAVSLQFIDTKNMYALHTKNILLERHSITPLINGSFGNSMKNNMKCMDVLQRYNLNTKLL